MEKGIDYEETYASIVRMEVVRMFLDNKMNKKFNVYHMYVKSAIIVHLALPTMPQAHLGLFWVHSGQLDAQNWQDQKMG